jgi:hypothetical protein
MVCALTGRLVELYTVRVHMLNGTGWHTWHCPACRNAGVRDDTDV